MSPPAPIRCEVDGCEYETPLNLSTQELQIRHLEAHIKMRHEISNASLSSNNSTSGGGAKPDKLPRPNISEGITDADWVWFEEQWRRYKRSTGLEGQSIIDQLWACANSSLARRCYEAGNTDNITEDDLLARMKKMSIRAQNKLVNIVEFLSMTQDTDEPVPMYISRLRG